VRLHCHSILTGDGRLFHYRNVDSRYFLPAFRLVLHGDKQEKVERGPRFNLFLERGRFAEFTSQFSEGKALAE
jgi:hypothetical protein